jgi:hypothetical protein
VTGLPDLASAIEWARKHWGEQRPVPTRLHVHEVQPDDLLGSPKLAPDFWRYLQGDATATYTSRHEVPCPLRELADCPRCGGAGYTIEERLHYEWPMTAALSKFAKVPATSKGWPTPYVMVVTLASNGWDVTRAAAAIGQPVLGPDHYKTIGAAFLLALRKLYNRYASAPLPERGWISGRSDAQRAAEGGTAA